MKIAGRLVKDGRWWLAEMPILDGLTQGKTRTEALAMASDWITTMAADTGMVLTVTEASGDRFFVSADRLDALVGLVLRRKREASGLSLADVARRLGMTSRNAYARYERGGASPSIAKLAELLHAVDPSHELALTMG